MARYELGEGAIFMLHEAGPGPGGLWHLPAHGTAGQSPDGDAYVTACDRRIAAGSAELLRLPFIIGLDMPDPARMCGDCHF